jgi:hypothetical protein
MVARREGFEPPNRQIRSLATFRLRRTTDVWAETFTFN